MDPERWLQVERLYHAALEREPNQRTTFLKGLCACDEELRHEVESLLDLEQQAKHFIESPALEALAKELTPAEIQSSPAEDPARCLLGKMVSHYRILEKIEGGGMGFVCKAQDTKLGRPVALKFMPPDLAANRKALRRFEREARTASALNHPNICTIYETDQHEGRPFIAMELLEGETLRRHLSGHPIGLKEIVAISTQVVDALEAAHGKDIIHRDIKPANIFITQNGSAKILDFGLAKPIEGRSGEVEAEPDSPTNETAEGPVTTTGEMMGTVAYMSPEQLRGEKLDSRTDLFSFGAVLYEMATGKQAFAGKTSAAIWEAVLNYEPEPPHRLNPEIPAKFDTIVRKALQKDRDKRYASASLLRRDLEALSEPLPAPLLSASPITGHRLVWAIATLTILLGVLSMAIFPDLRQRLLVTIWPPPIPAKRSVAVLPFKAEDAGAEGQAYCQGLGEAATDKLTLLTAGRNLQVVPAKEIVTRDIKSAGAARAELGANLVFRGSCSRSGNMMRVAFALVDTNSLQPLRYETIRGAASQPFALHNDVVQGMTRMLELELTPTENQTLTKHGTQVPGAYTYYLLGRGYLADPYKLDNVEKAISLFERSLELDSNHALAFSGLGIAFWQKYELTKDTSLVDTARMSCERAEAIDPRLELPHFCLGTVFNGTGQYEKAMAIFQTALELEPTSDSDYQGLAYSEEQLGQSQAAEQTFLQAIKLRPGYWPGYSWLGGFYYRQARYSEAAKMFEKVATLAPESFVAFSDLGGTEFALGHFDKATLMYERSVAIRPTGFALSNLAVAYFYRRHFTEAARTFERAVELDKRDYRIWGYLGEAYYWAPGERSKAAATFSQAATLAKEKLKVNDRDTEILRLLAVDYAMLGDRQAAETFLQRAHVLAPHDADLQVQAAIVHAMFDEKDMAIDCLEKAISWGVSRETVLNAPEFDKLHADPRFQNLVQAR